MSCNCNADDSTSLMQRKIKNSNTLNDFYNVHHVEKSTEDTHIQIIYVVIFILVAFLLYKKFIKPKSINI